MLSGVTGHTGEPPFIHGLELCRRYFAEIVQPLMERHFSALSYSAARIGAGSDVMGFDTEMSRDHDWGPRLQLLLSPQDYQALHSQISSMLESRLPVEFLGYPTSFALTTGENSGHRVECTTVATFVRNSLAFDIDQQIDPADWLTFPEQRLLELTAGAVFRDQVGLQETRARFAYYPADVWLYLMASTWERIGEEEHLVGRAGFVGDEIGARIIASRLVRDLMRLCFLMERRYPPYPKWFGTAFAGLECARDLMPSLEGVLQASGWEQRNERLVWCYRYVAEKQNSLNLTEPRASEPGPFFDRPFQVIELHARFAESLRARITDPQVRRIAGRRNIGSIDLFSDNTALLCEPDWRPALRKLYE